MIKNVKPAGDYVLLKFVSAGQTIRESGIILPESEEENKKYNAFVDAIGPDVETDKVIFEIGDKVVFNDYDLKKVDGETAVYGLIKAINIFATYE